MKLSEFNYNLPKELIAQKPASPRDHSRLLVFNKKTKQVEHKKFYNILDYLQKGDVLVFNDSKVIPARLIGKKQETGGKAEVFLLEKINLNKWQCLIKTKKAVEGLKIAFKGSLIAELIKKLDDKVWLVEFNFKGSKLDEIIEKIGETPLPPYIKFKAQNSKVKNQYQTVYAKNKGSVAAPTAGLHFTDRLLKKIKQKGVQFEHVTLHVGLGTFLPVEIEDIKKHKMHSEFLSINKKTYNNLKKAKKEKRRIIAVGTTSVRVLESVFSKRKVEFKNNKLIFRTNIFIYPGYKFKIINGLITNFHLPKSTLLMLVSSFIGRNKILNLYNKCVQLKYRFFSFGDVMFLVKD